VGNLHVTEVAGETVRVVVATAYCTAAAFGVWWPLDQLLGRSLPAQVVTVGLGLAAGGGAYLAAGRILALSDMDVLVALAGRVRGRAV
jgi:putative peptidoglycan lipid II flippase